MLKIGDICRHTSSYFFQRPNFQRPNQLYVVTGVGPQKNWFYTRPIINAANDTDPIAAPYKEHLSNIKLIRSATKLEHILAKRKYEKP